jgi:hypothetical protein
MVKTGYVPESIQPTYPDNLNVSIDRDVFVAYVTSSQTITLTYTSSWSADPSLYGITVDGTPVNGDQIVVVYVKENRGLITVATPTTFISTGWNLYNHAAGYARVVKYSDEVGFMIDGTYSALAFSPTLNGTQTPITPVNGHFMIPDDGFVFVTGGNGTDTEIWMTWADWTDEPNDGVFEAYSQTSVDLSGVMVNFPIGLMRVGNVFDEIDLNTSRAYSRVERLAYTQENLEMVIDSGVQYDTDTNYIYAARVSTISYVISLDGEYTVSDHGMEMFNGTNVAVTASSLYGNDLKGKLRRDVLTISQQTLTAAQKQQVYENLGLDELNNNFVKVWENQNPTASFAAQTLSIDLSAYRFILVVTSDGTGWVEVGIMTRDTFIVGGSASVVRGRSFKANTDSVVIGQGYGGSAVDNTNCIPQRIYGVK